jgi:hypothetical protein
MGGECGWLVWSASVCGVYGNLEKDKDKDKCSERAGDTRLFAVTRRVRQPFVTTTLSECHSCDRVKAEASVTDAICHRSSANSNEGSCV